MSHPQHSIEATPTAKTHTAIGVWRLLCALLPRIQVLSKVGVLALLWAVSAHAYAAKAPIYTSLFSNKAVGGYDVVSYFQGDGKPVKGLKKYTANYKGADWLFSSKENLDAFNQAPEKYEPQYGGYCAWAMAIGKAVKGDPLQYHIHEDKLYLNINKKYRLIWEADKLDFITKADAKWPATIK